MGFSRIFKKEISTSVVDQVLDWLVFGGLLLGLVTLFMEGQMVASFADSDVQNPWGPVVRSGAFKLVKVLEVFCVLSAGVLVYWTEGRFCVNWSVKWMLYILLFWMTGHALITFSGGFSPYELLDQKGPVVWWSLLFLFAGISKSRWGKIYPVIIAIVFIGCIEMAYRILSMAGHFDRTVAQRTLGMSLQFMLWSAPLIFLVSKKVLIWRILTLCPLVLIAIASFMTGTRSWLLVCLIYVCFIVYSAFKQAGTPETKVLVIMLTFVVLPLACFFSYYFFEKQINAGMVVLFSRLTEDTRSGQLVQFFESVPLTGFLFGTGPRGTWQWDGGDYGYVDGVYFFLLFLGGVPLLISYLYLVILPPVRCFFKKGILQYGTIDFAIIIMGLMWGVVMTGLGTYTMPELKINHYIVLLCVGRCWGLLLEAPSKSLSYRVSHAQSLRVRQSGKNDSAPARIYED